MERFHWLQTNNKLCLVYLECKLQREIMYLQGKKEQPRHNLTYLEISNIEKWYG